jgi:Soluble lytic murein transglycosylase and related regulatory proteins (some contain LysM/invasin domains)
MVAGIVITEGRSSFIQKESIPQNPANSYSVFSSHPIHWEDLSQKDKKYDPIIKAAASRYDINPFLIKAIIHVESRFDHLAVSPRGAVGLMQIRPRIASSQGYRDPFNPKENIYAGAGHLRFLLDFFEGDQHLALAAYNAGVSRVLIYEGVPPFRETRNYIQKVLFGFQYYSQQKKG